MGAKEIRQARAKYEAATTKAWRDFQATVNQARRDHKEVTQRAWATFQEEIAKAKKGRSV